MCPPGPETPTDIGFYWSDEQIVLSLDEFIHGHPLPANVIEHVDPYQYQPSVLPDGIWYLVSSTEKKETVHGVWKAKGEACEIYSNSMISGWRTTLEFFEGGERSNWLMQEYKITQKGFSDKKKPKESRSLCRVFCSSEGCPRKGKHRRSCKIDVGAKHINSALSITPGNGEMIRRDSKSESEAKVSCQELPGADALPTLCAEDSARLECVLKGDFLELDDLADSESHSSSSENSSRPSNASDEYFDSLALLQDLDEDYNKNMQQKDSISKYISSVRPNEVVIQPDISDCGLGAIVTGAKSRTEVFKPGESLKTKLPEKRVLDDVTESHKSEGRTEGPLIIHNISSFGSSSKKSPSIGEKKNDIHRKKKLKKYFCFLPF